MAAHYNGIERMLADIHWSTKSTYQIQSTFYVITQTPTEDLLCQTALGKMVPAGQSICIEMARGAAQILGRAAEYRGNERVDAGLNLRYLFEGKMNREVERPPIVQHRLLAVFRAVL